MLGAAFGLILPWKGVRARDHLFLPRRHRAGHAHAGAPGTARRRPRPSLDASPSSPATPCSPPTSALHSASSLAASGFRCSCCSIFRDRNPQGSVWRRALDGSAVLLCSGHGGSVALQRAARRNGQLSAGRGRLAVALLRRSWAPILRSVVAVTLGLGLAAIYLVPAAVEQQWVQIRQATDDPGLRDRKQFALRSPRRSDSRTARRRTLARFHHCRHHDRPGAVSASVHCVASRPLAGPTSAGGFRWRSSLYLCCCFSFPYLCLSGTRFPSCAFCNSPGAGLWCSEAPMGIFLRPPSGLTRRWLRLRGHRRHLSQSVSCRITGVTPIALPPALRRRGCGSRHAQRLPQRTGLRRHRRIRAAGRRQFAWSPCGLPDACLVTDPLSRARVVRGWQHPAVGSREQHIATQPIPGCTAPGQIRAEHLHLVATTPHAGYLDPASAQLPRLAGHRQRPDRGLEPIPLGSSPPRRRPDGRAGSARPGAT